jgi:hypothetical protein
MATCSSARELLELVLARYRGLRRYADQGRVRYTGRLRWAPAVRFATTFDAAAGDFKFRLERPHPYRELRHLITRVDAGQEAGRPYFRTERANRESRSDTPESLELAVAGATGISSGAAFHAWQLLFDTAPSLSLQSLERPRLRRYSVIDGVHCHRIAARLPMGRHTEFHIGVGDLFVRKIISRERGYECIEERSPEATDGEIALP